MTDLHHFEAKFKALIGKPTNLRPFVCDGSPYACRIFIAGQNPATSTSNFWQFWSAEGMDREAWCKSYLAEREGARPSPTRKRIERIAERVGLPILETNVYATEAASGTRLRGEEREVSVFRMLVEEIRPVVILAHGKKAQEEVKRISPPCHVIELPHLSGLGAPRGFNWETELEICVIELRRAALSGPTS